MRKYTFFLWLLASAAFAGKQAVVHTIPAPDKASGVAWDGTHIWCGTYGSTDDLYFKLDPATGGTLATFPNPPGYYGCYGLTYDGEYLWYLSSSYDVEKVYKLDTLGNRVDSFVFQGYRAGMTYDGTYLWIGAYYDPDGHIFKYSTAGDSISGFPAPESQPWGLTWDGTYLWNCDTWARDDSGMIYKIDPSDGSVSDSFLSPGDRPQGLTWDGSYLWVTARDRGSKGYLLYQIDVEAAGTPIIELSANEHDYGHTIVSEEEIWSLGITNNGTAELIVDSMVFDNSVFSSSTIFPDTVDTNATNYVPLSFIPTALDTFTGTATVFSNDPVHPSVIVTLQGIGIDSGPEIYLPDTSHGYGSIRVNAVKRWFLAIQNLGSETLVIDSVFSSLPEFFIEGSFPLNIDSTLRVDLPVWFSPTLGTSFDAELTIYNNDPDKSFVTVHLSGLGDDSPNPGGEVLWSYYAPNFESSIESIKSIPDMNGDGIDDVIAASENDTIYCINGNGSGIADVLWSFVTSPLWRDQELITVNDLDGDHIADVVIGTPWGGRSVIAISGATGDTIWMYDSHEYGGGGWIYEVAQIDDVDGDGKVDILAGAGDDGIGTGPGRAYCFSGATGEKIWEIRLAPLYQSVAIFSIRAIDDITGDKILEVAAGTGDTEADVHRVWMLNGATGDTIWSYFTGGQAVWSVVPIEDITGDGIKDVVAGLMDGGVVALDATDGGFEWSTNVGSIVEKLEIISDVNGSGYDDVLPSGTMSNFYCLEGENGFSIWDYPSGHKAFSAAPMPDVTEDGIEDVIAGSGYTYNRIYCLNGTNGDTIWTYPSAGAVETVYWLNSIDGKSSPECLTGSRNGQILCFSGGEITGVEEEAEVGSQMSEVRLQCYPNPFTAVVSVKCSGLSEGQKISLEIYDVTGRLVETFNHLTNRPFNQVTWDASAYPSGIYFVKFTAGSFTQTQKLILVR